MLDITSFIDLHFEDSVTSAGESDVRIDCPFCNDTKRHLYVSIESSKQVVHCFRCSYKANWVHFVMDYLGVPFWTALGELYHKSRMVEFDATIKSLGSRGIIKEEHPSEVDLPGDFVLATKSKCMLGELARKYLYKRGFDNETIDYYGIGVATSIPWRVIIPIEFDYWQGRRLYKWMTPKYINPKSEAKSMIFNSSALLNYDEIVVCEGAFSAMSVGPNAIGLIGKEPTRPKVERLMQSRAKHFIITVEPEAWPSIGELAKQLSRVGKDVTLWVYNVGDPANSNDFQILPYNSKTYAYMKLYK